MNYLTGTFYILKSKINEYYLDDNKHNAHPKRIFDNTGFIDNYKIFYGPSTKIMKNLYLGSSFNAYDKEEVLNNKINVIFNITVEIPNFHENIIYYNYPIKDNGIENITQILLTASSIVRVTRFLMVF